MKNYKYFIVYLHYDCKVKVLHIMLSKASMYVKHYNGHTTWMYFLIKIILFGIKSALILKKNLIAKLSTVKKFLKPK